MKREKAPDRTTMRGHFLDVLTDVANQVLRGKGEERHGRGREFGDQPTFKILDLYGPGYACGQAAKKLEEAKGFIERGLMVNGLNPDQLADREMLGAIGYIAMLVAWMRDRGGRL